MLPNSLAVTPHRCNSLGERLSHLFLLSIQYFYHHQSPATDIFINQLRVLVGLSYAVCHSVEMAQEDGEHYQKYFCRFINHSQGDFRRHWGALALLADAIAKLVIFAVESFDRINYPSLCGNFMKALSTALSNEAMIDARKKEEAQQLLHAIQQYP